MENKKISRSAKRRWVKQGRDVKEMILKCAKPAAVTSSQMDPQLAAYNPEGSQSSAAAQASSRLISLVSTSTQTIPMSEPYVPIFPSQMSHEGSSIIAIRVNQFKDNIKTIKMSTTDTMVTKWIRDKNWNNLETLISVAGTPQLNIVIRTLLRERILEKKSIFKYIYAHMAPTADNRKLLMDYILTLQCEIFEFHQIISIMVNNQEISPEAINQINKIISQYDVIQSIAASLDSATILSENSKRFVDLALLKKLQNNLSVVKNVNN